MIHSFREVALLMLLPVSMGLKVDLTKGKDTHAAVQNATSGEKPLIRVLSDFHIGGCWASDKKVQAKLLQFLSEMARPELAPTKKKPTHLIINGDIWDWWLVPLNETTPHPELLFNNTDAYGYNVPQVIDLIKDISKHTKVYVVRGNHDIMNSKELTKMAFGDAPVQFMEDGFEINGVWIEHGHVIDVYSNPPKQKDGSRKMGMGYFETRASADRNGWQCQRKNLIAFPDQMVDFAKKTHPIYSWLTSELDKSPMFNGTWVSENFVRSVFTPLMQYSLPEHLRWTDWRAIPVKGFNRTTQKVTFEDASTDYTLGDALTDHVNDWKLGVERMGVKHFKARLWACMEDLFEWVAFSRKHLVVVTGHTHDALVELRKRSNPDQSVSDYVVQANSGGWAADSYHRKHSSYLDIAFEQHPERIDGVMGVPWRPTSVAYFEYPEEQPRQKVEVPPPKEGRKLGGFDFALHPDKDEMTISEPQKL